MTTPNEELRKLAEAAIPAMVYEREYKNFEKSITPECVIALLDQLQSQAERVATLEDDVEYLQEDIDAMCNAIPSYHWMGGAAELIAKCFADRDTLRAELADAELHTKQVERGLDKATAQLEAIAANEPVAKLKPCKEGWFIDLDNPPPITGETIELFTRPMPAQDVNAELVEAFGKLYKKYVNLLESGRDRILDLGGSCDPVDVMEMSDPGLRDARTALSKYKGVKQ